MEKTTNISKVFIGFLVTSVFIWLLINLSKEYESTVKYSVVYEELPQDKVFEEAPVNQLNFLVRGSGFKLVLANFSDKKITLKTNKLSKKSINNYYLLANSQKIEIQKQLTSGLQLAQVLSDTIFLKIGNLQTKKVPVSTTLDIQYQVGYNKVGDVKISPDSILISGPELQLEKINSINTTALKLENVAENIVENIAILLPDNNKLKTETKVVRVEVIVDKFTEGEVEVPVNVINIPEETTLNIFPKTLKITYKVGLKNFNKVSPQSFEVVCDYQQTLTNELTYLIPKVVQKSNLVSGVRLSIDKIDFLIHK